MQKRVLAIHDISCVGRCSLTVALPILSVAGCDTGVLPTAVLSTHTGGFSGFTYRDLASDISPIAQHWASLGIQYDAMYSGFLGSVQQVDMLIELFEQFGKNGLILVDPVMADNGQLYSVFDNSMVEGMRTMCSHADIIVPNLTEASLLLDQPYVDSNYTLQYIHDMAVSLSRLGARQVVLTGVSFDDNQLGAYCYDASTDSGSYVYNDKQEGHYHGTGDIFGSTLLASLMCGKSLVHSTQIAVDYTLLCIRKCIQLDQERRYGVPFEQEIPSLVALLEL